MSDDGQRTYEITEETATIRSAGPYRVRGLELATLTTDRRLGGGKTVTRTVAFEVETDRTYLFTIPTTDWYSGADNHYVPLGKVRSSAEELVESQTAIVMFPKYMSYRRYNSSSTSPPLSEFLDITILNEPKMREL